MLICDCREILRALPDESVHCVVTSPPYWGLRDYGIAGQLGLEPTPDAYVANMVDVFREVRRVLRRDGTLWLNLGDSYFGTGKGPTPPTGIHGNNGIPYPIKGVYSDGILKQKDLCGIPWRVAFALQTDGWYLRQDIIWSKPNPMPESVTDRCTKAHEYIFLLSKSERYYYDQEAIAEPITQSTIERLSQPTLDQQEGGVAGSVPWEGMSRNKRSVWEVTTQPFSEAHFGTFPPALIEPCILAGCPKDGTVLDPFGGAGTTGLVADRLQRNAVLIELNPEYAAMAERRIQGDAPLFTEMIRHDVEVCGRRW
jgi:DNA modification methylase